MREDVRKAITTLAAFGQDSDIGANMRKIFYEEVRETIFEAWLYQDHIDV